jgi:sulfoxide reductase heme-binding subunit YedZ
MPWLRSNWHRLLAHVAGLAPLVLLAIGYLADALGADPLRTLTLRTGTIGLILLVAALACTPANTLFGWRRAVQIRRPLGLYAFTYISLHLLLYAVYDGALDLELIWRDLGERRAMAIGLLAFLALVPLAITSTTGWQRRLGKRWRQLHWLVYLAVPLSVLHFYWLDRDIKTEPLIYAVIVGMLLALRVRPLRRAFTRLRRREVTTKASANMPCWSKAISCTSEICSTRLSASRSASSGSETHSSSRCLVSRIRQISARSGSTFKQLASATASASRSLATVSGVRAPSGSLAVTTFI